MNTPSTKELLRNKVKDLFDKKNRAFYISIILSIILFIISFLIKMPANILCEKYIEYLDGIAMAYIGFLGFIVTGLAILTSAISSKLYSKLIELNLLKNVQNILTSFLLLGLIAASIISISFIFHFVSMTNFNANIWALRILVLILSYFIFFTIFYAAFLIGDCLDLIYIFNEFEIKIEKEHESEQSSIQNALYEYSKYRIMALEKMILKSQDDVFDYQKTIKELLEKDSTITPEEKEILLKYHSEHFKSIPSNEHQL